MAGLFRNIIATFVKSVETLRSTVGYCLYEQIPLLLANSSAPGVTTVSGSSGLSRIPVAIVVTLSISSQFTAAGSYSIQTTGNNAVFLTMEQSSAGQTMFMYVTQTIQLDAAGNFTLTITGANTAGPPQCLINRIAMVY